MLDIFTSKPRGSLSQPYVIAEIGVNHEGDMDNARRMIDEAKEGGADAVKFQAYKARTLASKDSPAYWDLAEEPTTSQYELFKKHDAFWKDEFEQLKAHCDKTHIDFLCTPFDVDSAEFLKDMMPCFKVSSSDLTNQPFIQFLCDYSKPILLSCGASYMWEIERAVAWILEKGNPLALMHCVLNYPTLNEHANLGMISLLKEKFPNLPVGYSDHTLPGDMQNLEVATLLGAVVLEKHFTFDKSLCGNDHYHAMDKHDLALYRASTAKVIQLMGDGSGPQLESQMPARKNARRSLVVKERIGSGEIITEAKLTWKRPASGICPSHIQEVVGRKACVDLEDDTVLDWSHIGDYSK